MDAEKRLVYLILGATGSGRRDVLADLAGEVEHGGDRAAVLLPAAEGAQPADATLPRVAHWEWQEGGGIAGSMPAEATHVFFVVDGRRNPVDQVEAFRGWAEAQGGEVARVVCVVDCQLAERHPPLLPWFEACIHFSDVVLLNRREGVENKWMSDFLTRFRKQFYPSVFEFVKDGRVKNPALVLEPQARRISHVFDEERDWVFRDASGEEIDEQEETEAGEEIEATPEEDPYFERRMGGRRVRELPDIARYL
jgi:hypothetical protein